VAIDASRILEERQETDFSHSTLEALEIQPVNMAAKFVHWLAPILLVVIDYLSIIFALKISGWIRELWLIIWPGLQAFRFEHFSFFYIIPLIYMGLISFERLYTKRMPFWLSAQKLFKICTYASAIIIGIIYLSGLTQTFSRLFVVINWLVSFVVLVCARFATKRILGKWGLWQKPVIFVGSCKMADLVASAFSDEPNMGYAIVGVIDEKSQSTQKHQIPIFRNVEEAENLIKFSKVEDVIIASQGLGKEKLMDLVYRVQPLVKNLAVIPDLVGLPMSNLEVDTLVNQKVILLNVKNNLLNRWNWVFKRIFDLIAGCFFFILSLPIMIFLIIWIRLDSSGPAFYNGKRIGKSGKEFTCYKFRTMHVNGDRMLDQFFFQNPDAKTEWDKYAKLKAFDPRVTRVGKILRKFSLDELPQIFNVLKGDMSLVGPRPYLPRERERMGYYYGTIIEAVPGITGLWQVSGRNDVEFEGRLSLDSWYVRNWSFWMDITLLFKTVGVVFLKKGAF
jgi:Undecaprenyl-phosphate galactose phosphotransferase WbaP